MQLRPEPADEQHHSQAEQQPALQQHADQFVLLGAIRLPEHKDPREHLAGKSCESLIRNSHAITLLDIVYASLIMRHDSRAPTSLLCLAPHACQKVKRP